MSTKKQSKKSTGTTTKDAGTTTKTAASRTAASKKSATKTAASRTAAPKKSATRTAATGSNAEGFTAEERAAMKERARELKADAGRSKRRRSGKSDGESDVLAKIAEMPEPDQAMARRIHEIVKASAPQLSPKTWYGMPAYARDGKVVCFFQGADKFKTRLATLGFSDEAKLDEGSMWPTSFALKKLTSAEESRIRELVKRAAG